MSEESLEDLVLRRTLEQAQVPLWQTGPTFASLLDRFFESCASAAHLDAWLPMASPKAHPVVVFFFQGASLRLADRLVVHRKIAITACMFAAINHLFPSRDINETSQLILGLSEPVLDGQNQAEGIHFLGASAIDEWLQAGIETAPPTKQMLRFVELTDKFAVPDVRNPSGLADVAARAVAPSRYRRDDDA